ncbi:MAG TPA: hypothetical protein VF755_28755 [Catenuloplanes sp.]
MYMVNVSIVHTVDRTKAKSTEALRELVLANVSGTDRVQHVYVRAGPNRIEVVLFVQAINRREADITGYRVCARTCTALPGAYPDN